eukprot:Hpha_TRINITY_DN27457_c0_g1::TRINITY_DN27457_c0_g1_i1::g.193912::m.193912
MEPDDIWTTGPVSPLSGGRSPTQPPSPPIQLSPILSPRLSPQPERQDQRGAVLSALHSISTGQDVGVGDKFLSGLSGTSGEVWHIMLSVILDPAASCGVRAVAASWLAQNGRRAFTHLPPTAQASAVVSVRRICTVPVLSASSSEDGLRGMVAALSAVVALVSGDTRTPAWPDAASWGDPVQDFCGCDDVQLRCALLSALVLEVKDARLKVGPARRQAVRAALRSGEVL